MIKIPAYIHFLKSGLLSSVQDNGRKGMAQFGIPYAGAMDHLSLFHANHLINNPAHAACLEMSQIGPEMVFELPTRIVFAGAIAEIFLNNKQVPLGKVIEVQEDDHLRIGKFTQGQWLYMAIQDGFETELVAGSRSWYPTVTSQAKIKKGDSICYLAEERYFPESLSHAKITSDWYTDIHIGAYAGPEWMQLSADQQHLILNQEFTVSNLIDRMAYQLEETIPNDLEPILTAPVYPGTVQLTPSGKMLVLMRDAQVTGGYPRILHVEEQSLNILAQKRSSERIKFYMEP